uniref:IF rod domain-containing protein n=1 Tax=Leptobrachium leishanense TaxID=445787 RepID=A0A8C5QTQ1_9ANUR
MSHSIKSSHSPVGSIKGSSHVGNLSPRIARLICAIQPQGFKKVNHDGMHKPISVQAPESKNSPKFKHNSFSARSAFGLQEHFGKYAGQKNQRLLTANEKDTMRLLNDRLASYLEKVRLLEQENAKMEKKIRDWYDTHQPQMLPNFNHYFETIQELQTKILLSAAENTRTARRIDNARLAAEDFQTKYEMEQKLRRDIDLDVQSLHNELGDLQMEVQRLDIKSQDHQQDLLEMKKKNEDLVKTLYGQLGARVTVEVETAPSVDLNILLGDIRDQYEELMENNKIEAEKWFIEKSSQLKNEVDNESSEQLSSFQSEIIELKRIVQTLEIDKQSQISMNSALETTLGEKEASYSSQLSHIQEMVHDVEAKLSRIRDKQKQQSYDYQVLRDVTLHLEREITTYRSLIDKQDIHVSRPPISGRKEMCPKGLKVLSITEEMESRKILSPREKC